MHPADIQAALKKCHVTQTDIAKARGVGQNTVSLVIHRRTKSWPVAREISRRTGIPVETLFPGYSRRGL